MADESVAAHDMAFVGERESSMALPEHDLAALVPSELTPLSPQVIARQSSINLGTIGHVAHGKSTVVRALSGVQTVRFKTELVRNITIKLGYANAKIYQCTDPSGACPSRYCSHGSSKEVTFKCPSAGCDGTMQLVRHVSFVDCFGPDAVFATPAGTIRNADIVEGTVLLGPDGKERVVGAVADGVKPMYRVSYEAQAAAPVEETGFTASGGHLLCLRIDTPVDAPVYDESCGKYKVRTFQGRGDGMASTVTAFDTAAGAAAFYAAADKAPVYFEMTVETYLSAPPSVRRRARMYVAPAMEFGAPAVDPSIGDASAEEVAWAVGLWLGSGDAVQPRTTPPAGEGDVAERVADVAAKMGLVALESTRDNAFWQLLVALGVADNKHIPAALLSHSLGVRAALAAGLVDAAGSYSAGRFDLELPEAAHAQLFGGFVRLLRTMGFVARCSRGHTTAAGKEHATLRVCFGGGAAMLPTASPARRGKDAGRAWTTSVAFDVAPIGPAPFRRWQVDGDQRVLLDSFVVGHNCPGHDILMATMLNGAAVMDAALLLIAGNESCPQPQTSEHLAAIEIMQLRHIIILQNKIDLVKEAAAREQHNQIQDFVKSTVAQNAPVVPISAQLKYNMDILCEYICTKIPVPPRDFTSSVRLIVIRSFDVNKPGSRVEDLQGGVAGGSILRGVLKVGDEVEIRPGMVTKNAEGKVRCNPIFSRVVSLFSEKNDLKFAVPGGLIGVGTKMDPMLCRADRLVGQVLGEPGQLPDVFIELEVNFFLLRRLLGVRAEDGRQSKVAKLAKGESLMVNIGSTSTGGRVYAVQKDLAKISLHRPVCTQVGEKIALSRRVEKHWRLIGWGEILRGVNVEVAADEAHEAPEESDSAEDSLDPEGSDDNGAGGDGEE